MPANIRPTNLAATTTPGDSKRAAFAKVAEAIKKSGARLRKYPNVLSIRPGYRFRDGWITDEPAIVVTVRRKLPADQLAKGEALPRSVGGVPVDVAPATPVEQLRAEQAGARAAAVELPEVDYATPGWELVGAPPMPEPEEAAARGAVTAKYLPPPDATLDEVSGPMTITCHASPDAGWPTLKPFLAGTKQRLTVGMYDFSAPHIFEALEADLDHGTKTLSLVLDPGLTLGKGGAKAKDITEDKIHDGLVQELGKKFQFAWAAVGHKGKVAGGLFPSAYHIKVAVRDGKSFWLSSGNWQSTNQPDIDPLKPGAPDKIFGTYNREWHVIVDHPGLAKTYEKFLLWDLKQAAPFQVQPEARGLPDLLVPAPEAIEARGLVKFFPPKTFKFTAKKPLRVQPVLTPDNYAESILKLINSAKKTLYIENQYIQVKKQNLPGFQKLVEAVAAKFKAGLDVRIILRDGGDSRTMLETLAAQGYPPDRIRLLHGCHNKGIIVDSKAVALGSHNWSNDGTIANRDATLIFYDSDVAKYYEEIFLFDWDNLARHRVTAEKAMPVVATSAEGAARGAAPEGMVLMGWDDYFED